MMWGRRRQPLPAGMAAVLQGGVFVPSGQLLVIGDGGYVAVAEQETLMAYNKRSHNPPVFGWSNRGEGKACSCPVATKFEMKGKTGDSSEDWTERQEKEKERRK